MDSAALVMGAAESGADFLRRFHAVIPVAAAYWMKEEERVYPYLYVASEQFAPDRDNRPAYAEAQRIVSEMNDPHLKWTAVTLVGTDDPIAKAVLDFYRRYPGRAVRRAGPPRRLRRSNLHLPATGEGVIGHAAARPTHQRVN